MRENLASSDSLILEEEEKYLQKIFLLFTFTLS